MVFRLGYDAGFFSEYNNMILAAVYCAVNKIQFRINSNYANFKIKEGWNDYRPYLRKPQKVKERIIKYFNRIDFLTQDLWNAFRSNEFLHQNIEIKELEFKDSLLNACHQFVNMSWHLNPELENCVTQMVDTLHLPESYVGLHIRRGDKSKETGTHFRVSEYLDFIGSISHIRNLFVSTDDYAVIEEIQNYATWNIYHNVSSRAKGYFQDAFDLLDQQSKFKSLSELLCNVEILAKSTVFVGSINTNVAMFIGMYRGGKNSYYIDSEKWKVW